MNDLQLTPGRVVYQYDIDGPCFFAHENKQVEAVEFYVESDFYHPENFAIQVMTKCNKSIIFEGSRHGTWPLVARRLYRMHVAELRKAGLHV